MRMILIGALLILGLASCATEEQHDVTLDRGEQVFAEYCVRCHGADGQGARPDVPNIAEREFWQNNSDTLLFILAFGMDTDYSTDSIVRTMPPIPYNDADIAAVATYVSYHIGNNQQVFTAEDVQRVKSEHREALRQRFSAHATAGQ